MEPWLALGAAACLLPVVPAPVALLVGLTVGMVSRGAGSESASRWSKRLLAMGIVLLGLGVGRDVFTVGPMALLVAAASVAVVLVLSLAFGRVVGVAPHLRWLNGAGAAICGGSAIAAVGRAIDARGRDLAVALGTVFALNAVAVVAFPFLGAAAGLSQEQFGVWAALAIHDTASVVAAAGTYGTEALETATVWKLARALWIAPVALLAARRFAADGSARLPWFIGGFVATAVARVLIGDHALLDAGAFAGRRLVVAAVFLVGASWRPGLFQGIGRAPWIQVLLVWAVLSLASLAGVLLWLE